MNIVRHTDQDYESQIDRAVATTSLFDPVIEERTRQIIDAVRTRGDEALLELTARFDGAQLSTESMSVTAAESMAASLTATPELRAAVKVAHKNVADFARRSRRRSWSARNSHGATVGEKFDPFERVGIYIPGGTAPLVSSAIMCIALAKVAGCPEIVVCTPPGRDGSVNPALLFAAKTAGATEIYKVGGAQAIAAMSLGTATIRRVQKVYGPGNAYVVTAKRLLVGAVAIDQLPGPSEVCIIADLTADPAFVAADLLAQAEHGSGHERVWLLTPSAKLLKSVEKEMGRQLPKLARREYIEKVLSCNGWLIQVPDLPAAVTLANRLAPEHTEVMTRDARKLSEGLVTSGAIFLGGYSPTVLGDYVAGPSHVLPTGGAARSFAGLTVDQFQRRTSLVEYNKASLKKAVTTVRKFADLEGLDAHGRSAEIRLR